MKQAPKEEACFMFRHHFFESAKHLKLVSDTHPIVVVFAKVDDPENISLIIFILGNIDGHFPRPHDLPVS